jgi:hypothetical protein
MAPAPMGPSSRKVPVRWPVVRAGETPELLLPLKVLNTWVREEGMEECHETERAVGESRMKSEPCKTSAQVCLPLLHPHVPPFLPPSLAPLLPLLTCVDAPPPGTISIMSPRAACTLPAKTLGFVLAPLQKAEFSRPGGRPPRRPAAPCCNWSCCCWESPCSGEGRERGKREEGRGREMRGLMLGGPRARQRGWEEERGRGESEVTCLSETMMMVSKKQLAHLARRGSRRVVEVAAAEHWELAGKLP